MRLSFDQSTIGLKIAGYSVKKDSLAKFVQVKSAEQVLQARVEELESENSRSQSEIRSLKEDSARAITAEAERVRRELEMTILDLQNKLSDSENKLTQMANEKQTPVKDNLRIDRLTRELDDMNKTLQDNARTITESENENLDLKRRIKQYEEKLDNVSAVADGNAAEKIAELQNTVDQLNTKWSDQVQSLEDQNTKLMDDLQKLENIEEMHKEQTEEIEMQQEELEVANAELEDMKERIAQTETIRNELEQKTLQIQEYDETIAELNEAADISSAELKVASEELEELRQEVQSLKQSGGAQVARDDEEAIQYRIEEAKEVWQSEIDTEMEDLRAQVDRLQHENQKLSTAVAGNSSEAGLDENVEESKRKQTLRSLSQDNGIDLGTDDASGDKVRRLNKSVLSINSNNYCFHGFVYVEGAEKEPEKEKRWRVIHD